MTGTEDDSPVGDTKAEERRIPFDHSKGSDEFLVTFKDGDHMIFSGRLAEARGPRKGRRISKADLPRLDRLWDAYLKGDENAKSWFTGSGFESALKDQGKFEKNSSQSEAEGILAAGSF